MSIKYENQKEVVFDPEWQEWMVFRPNRQGGVYCVGAYKTKAEAEEAHEKAAKREQWQRDNFAEEVKKWLSKW